MCMLGCAAVLTITPLIREFSSFHVFTPYFGLCGVAGWLWPYSPSYSYAFESIFYFTYSLIVILYQ